MTSALSSTRYACEVKKPKAINSVTARVSKDDARVDVAMYAYLTFAGPQYTEAHSQIYTYMTRQWIGGIVSRIWELPSIEFETERAIIFFYNAMMTHLHHYVSVTDKTTGQTQYNKQYEGGPLWENVITSVGKVAVRTGAWAVGWYTFAMEELRIAARKALPQHPITSSILPEVQADNIALPDELSQLWENILSQQDTSNLTTCESLLVAYSFLKSWAPESLSGDDEAAANSLYDWASNAALPSPVYAQLQEPLDDGTKEAIREDQLRSRVALSVLSTLAELLPIYKAENTANIIIALASFTFEEDPWTTQEAYVCSTTLLATFTSESSVSFWSVIEKILKERIRPIFAKTRNPAITSAGRKNFHPVPLPRFDASILDQETKPWKIHDVYTSTVLSWAIKQYKPTDSTHLEAHFPLLVPPLLALIDDDSTIFKTKGCKLLIHLLTPIKESNFDILHRTNLSSVFEDALRPCLLSLPTITPELDAINLLGQAYPALLLLQQTTHQNAPLSTSTQSKQTYFTRLTRTLRENLIPSFHHISSTNTTSSTASFASFPYPRLSTLLLDQMILVLQELSIHTTKYLQEIIPLLHNTLSNPFGPAYPPLLLSAVAVTRTVILNAHPRVWRWRGEILGAICSCWLHAFEEEKEVSGRAEKSSEAMIKLKKGLRGAVYLLKFALENSVQSGQDAGQLEAKETLERELKELVSADENLGGLLLEDIDADDGGFFGED
ncbi:hypothetical protein BBP40_000152 [Aspergillus hancockii]|nr:hypothetical protein BBP40_000152 [Aspergillus hancockii]